MNIFENMLKKYGKIATFMLNSAFIQSYVVTQLLMKILLRQNSPWWKVMSKPSFNSFPWQWNVKVSQLLPVQR